MEYKMKKTLIIIFAIIIIVAWFYSERYMYVGSSEDGSCNYVMNKWTGKIYHIGTGDTGFIGKRNRRL
jgi:hypothetical protein